MRSIKFYLFIFLTPAVLLLFQNCAGESFKAIESSDSFSFCKAQTKTESPFVNNPVQISDKWFLGIQKASNESIELAVLIDVECYEESQNSSFLGQSIQLSDFQKSLSKSAVSFSLSQMPPQEELEDEIERNHCIIGVSENSKVIKSQVSSAATGNDPQINNQKHLDFLGYDKSRELINDINRKVVVAVIDSGIEYTHNDLRNRMWQNNSGHFGYNFVSNNTDPLDDDGHGTHVAGIIAAEENNSFGVTGLTGDFVELMAVKVLDSQGNGTSQNVHDGIQFAINNGADIINLSIEAPGTNALMESAIRDAVNAGIVVTMATGNSGQEMTSNNLFSPSYVGPGLEGAISVTSIDSDTSRLSVFSNYSTTYAEIAAPGAESSSLNDGILSATLRNGFRRIRGTSQSTPMVSAAAASIIGYLKTRNTNYTPGAVETYIKTSGVLRSNSLTTTVSNGRILNMGILSTNLLAYFNSGSGDSNNLDGDSTPSVNCQTQ